MLIDGRVFENYTYIMAIVNLTPDSFFAGSRAAVDTVLYAVEKHIKEGASIIDLGAQSTRPGYEQISEECELERLLKPLEMVKARFDIPISADTYFPSVAAEAVKAGAAMVNDVRGLSSPKMAEAVARGGASVCIMHDGALGGAGEEFSPVITYLKQAAARAEQAGIARDKICVDGGVGFGKNAVQSRLLVDNYERLKETGYPLLLGASRKSFLGGKVEERLPATLQTTYLAAQKGVLFVRVHDVKENAEVIRKVYGY